MCNTPAASVPALLIVLTSLVGLLIACPADAQQLPLSDCPHKSRWTPPPSAIHSGANLCNADLAKVNLHAAKLTGANLTLANLSSAHRLEAKRQGADLSDADLSYAQLSGANLSQANLHAADLSNAHFQAADLSGADLSSADMSGADLSMARMTDADLFGASLFEANLADAHLSNADLRGANLSRANLDQADLTKVKLSGANLTDTFYQPRFPELDPDVLGIEGLTMIRVRDNYTALVWLRKLLDSGGLRDDARQVTYAIEHARTRSELDDSNLLRKCNGVLRYTVFDVPVQYGLRPARALLIIFGSVVVFTPLYMFVLLHPRSNARIVQILPADPIELGAQDTAVEQDAPLKDAVEQKERQREIRFKSWGDTFRTAAYFSLLSSFDIGWQDYKLSEWLQRLQFREYRLQAVGWVRFVSGLQSLIGLFLLALYFTMLTEQPFG